MNRKTLNISLFVLTAIIISLIVPTYSSFNYEFVLGQTWKGDRITTTFDFPINKTTDEYNADVENFTANYVPIYKLDTTLSEMVGKSVSWFLTKDTELGQYDVILSELDNILSVGIIDTTYYLKSGVVKLIKGEGIRTVSADNLYTPSQAIAKLAESSGGVLSIADIRNLRDIVIPNARYSTELNNISLRNDIDRISKTKGFVSKGSVILKKGDKIDAVTLNILNSYRDEYYKVGASGFSYISYFGYFIYVLLIMMLSYFSLKSFRADVMDKLRNVLFLLLLYIGSVTVMSLVIKHTSQNIYIIPFTIIPLYISAFYSSRMSVHQYIYVLFISALLAPKPVEFILVNFLGGIVAILVIKRFYQRHMAVVALLGSLATYMLIYTVLTFITGEYIYDDYSVFLWFLVNTFFAVVLYQFLFIIEKVFGFVTKITLFDLCDTNRKLLRDLATKAPGTFQHSIQVSNLAESAAKAIGANDLLARTGALYHDIGKVANPSFFIENVSLDKQPHGNLTPKQSADIIRKHVIDGVALARKFNLPDVIVEFIASHHGDSLIYFFYRREVDLLGEDAVDEQDFRYPCPKPVSKEASIGMICDSVEAASRSLSEYSEGTISDLVESIVSNQIGDGLLAESKLEMCDISKIKESLKSSLVTVYHTRIAYPKRG